MLPESGGGSTAPPWEPGEGQGLVASPTESWSGLDGSGRGGQDPQLGEAWTLDPERRPPPSRPARRIH